MIWDSLFSAQVGIYETCANYELLKPVPKQVPNRFFRPIFFSVLRRECEKYASGIVKWQPDLNRGGET